MRRRFPTAALVLLALVAAPAAFAGSIVLDAFSDPFPPNPFLPASQRPVIFAGPYCDGVLCPPDAWVSDVNAGHTEQAGLPGVRGGQRSASVNFSVPTAPAVGSVDLAAHALRFTTSDPGNAAGFWLDYAGGVDDWNLDFPALGITGIALGYWGNATPAQPVTCIVDFFEHGTGMVEASLELGGSGPVQLPLAAFHGAAAFDWHGVDMIRVAFLNCWRPFGCPGPYPARTTAIGPITLQSDAPTPAAPRTWGSLKVRYR